MAIFTGGERAAIRQYLGYSELYKDLDTRLEGMLDQMDQRAPDAQARIRRLLSRLQAVDNNIDAVTTGGELTLKVAEDGVTFAGEDKIVALQNYGRTLIRQMAITFEVEPKADYYGQAGGTGGLFILG